MQQSNLFTNAVEWEEIEETAAQLLNVSTRDPEMRWAENAWEALEAAGLTQYDTTAERVLVSVRLAVVGRFHRRFKASTIQYASGPRTDDLLDSLDILPARLMQLVLEDFAGEEEFDNQRDLLKSALQHLIEEERERVLEALKDGFGGSQSFFVWLWLSSREESDFRYDTEERWDEEEEVWREEVIYEYSDGEIFNRVMNSRETDGDKMVAYQWYSDHVPGV